MTRNPSRFSALFSLALLVAMSVASTARAQTWQSLSQREQSFLNMVMDGDEAKATEYVKLAGINPDAIGGKPLSWWFYTLELSRAGPPFQRNAKVQHLVFATFKQNPNPANVSEVTSQFCTYGPFPRSARNNPSIEAYYKDANIEDMENAFMSLIHYGLKDRAIINHLFTTCVFGRGNQLVDQSINAYMYDHVIATMLRQGANINIEYRGERPLQFAVRTGYAVIVEKLIHDGAEVNFVVRAPGFPPQTTPCAPRADKTLFVYARPWLHTKNPELLVRIIRALASGGVSALTKYGMQYPDGCRYKSFYDAVIDTGNISLAAAVKQAAEEGTREASQHHAAAAPAASAATAPAPSAPPSSAPDRTQQAAAQSPAAPPPHKPVSSETHIGVWRVVLVDGRPEAYTHAPTRDNDARMAGLTVKCIDHRAISYRPATSDFLHTARSLFVGDGEDMKEFELVNGEARGPTAADLGDLLTKFEVMNSRGSLADRWGLEMTTNQWNAATSEIPLAGYSKMMTYFLLHCFGAERLQQMNRR